MAKNQRNTPQTPADVARNIAYWEWLKWALGFLTIVPVAGANRVNWDESEYDGVEGRFNFRAIDKKGRIIGEYWITIMPHKDAVPIIGFKCRTQEGEIGQYQKPLRTLGRVDVRLGIAYGADTLIDFYETLLDISSRVDRMVRPPAEVDQAVEVHAVQKKITELVQGRAPFEFDEVRRADITLW